MGVRPVRPRFRPTSGFALTSFAAGSGKWSAAARNSRPLCRRLLRPIEALTAAGNMGAHRAVAIYLVPSQPCSERSIVTPSGPVNLTSTLPRLAISSVPG
jgi:hypothetical protein